MLVWVLVGERTVRAEGAGWVVGVVHARPEIGVGVVLILVVEAEGMADLLTHHHVSPSGRVVLCAVEICIVDFGSTLHNVATADPDLGQAEPAVGAILIVAYLHPPTTRTAVASLGFAGDDCRVQHA